MAIRAKIHRGPRLRLDARELVAAAGDAAVEAMRDALLEGVSPIDGSPRPRNAEGRPIGVRSGHLANGLRRGAVEGNTQRAQTMVQPPADRTAWVAERGDVVVAEGRVGDAIQDTANAYAEGG